MLFDILYLLKKMKKETNKIKNLQGAQSSLLGRLKKMKNIYLLGEDDPKDDWIDDDRFIVDWP